MNNKECVTKNLLAAAMKPLWYRNVMRGSGRFLRYVFKELVMVLLSHSNGSSRAPSLSAFRRSRPIVSSFDTFELTPTTL